ncbi:MAG: hypothetical protein HZB33_02615, partial [Nitrospirae bacterium]|nr:hypothetical protein [Nitrospirota bacterium]
YPTLQVAYDAMVEGDTIESPEVDFAETLSVNRNISVTLKGGYNCDFSNVVSTTSITGALVIDQGTLAVENIVIK